jgi:hypothetical protein
MDSLNFLLKASDKKTVEKCMRLVFISRFEPAKDIGSPVQSLLGLDTIDDAVALVHSIRKCLEAALTSNSDDQLALLFEEDGMSVNGDLKNLVQQIINNNRAAWHEASIINRVSLPRYVSMDWAVNMKRASSEVGNMSVPSVLLQLEIEDQPDSLDQPHKTTKLDLELSKEKLEALLDGLNSIKDRLSHM